MRKGGLEPPRDCSHKLLRLARLPIPPLPQVVSARPARTSEYSEPTTNRRENFAVQDRRRPLVAHGILTRRARTDDVPCRTGGEPRAVPGRSARRKAATVAARRGVWLVFSLILLAVAISMTGVAASYFLFSRGPSVPSRTTLELRLTGDVAEVQGGDIFEQFMPEQPTVRGIVETLRRAKSDPRVSHLIVRPTGSGSFWAKTQEIRDAILDFRKSGQEDRRVPRIRRRSGVLPRHRVRTRVPAADQLARSEGPRDLRSVPARHVRQDRRRSPTCCTSATTRRR